MKKDKLTTWHMKQSIELACKKRGEEVLVLKRVGVSGDEISVSLLHYYSSAACWVGRYCEKKCGPTTS